MEVDYDLVGDGINLDKIDPINQKRLLTFVNFWLSNVGRFLNNSANRFEITLQEADRSLQRLEASMSLLEAKLALIPNITEYDGKSMDANRTKVNDDSLVPKVDKEVPKDTTVNSEQTVSKVNESAAVSEVQVSSPENDPAYAKYFKMLKLGVPLLAVKQKVASDKLDPAVLDGATVTSKAQSTPSKQIAKNDDSDFDDSHSSASSFSD